MNPIKISFCPICKGTIKWTGDIGQCKCPGKTWKPIQLTDEQVNKAMTLLVELGLETTRQQ
jgi:hypothetical protein